ncbi:hypothetical protein GRS66_010573 [Saccharomyces pastorianus]|uniref:Prokaryotic-type class I peptide chain release factors domain-containing protein n=2 Tax=Saccharomyces TaxID=4930 RepID=A0A6C1EG82_SACPS|nr:hypothetical protein GRS66_010573 [Saccharomyces pastorianus]CAI1703589.1 hypothetical protein SEUBUCD650_0O00480 [Saccharomyces eubayanus]
MTTYVGNYRLVRCSSTFALIRTGHCREPLCITGAVRLIVNGKNWRELDVSRAKDWVKTLSVTGLPLKQFVLRYDRASGPGGQNVNKVNSKCTLTLHGLSNFSWIPQEVKSILCSGRFRYYTKNSDSVVIQSDETRSKQINKLKCFEKLIQEIKQTCQFPNDIPIETAEKWAKIKKKSNAERILNKKVHSDKKKSRGKITLNY